MNGSQKKIALRRNTTRQENKMTAGGKYEHFDREWFGIVIQGYFE